MKFIISLFLVFNAQAAPINIYFEKDMLFAQKIIEKLTNDYYVPDNLMAKKKINSCKSIDQKSKLDLCIDADGELYVLNVDKEFINKSLSIFLN